MDIYLGREWWAERKEEREKGRERERGGRRAFILLARGPAALHFAAGRVQLGEALDHVVLARAVAAVVVLETVTMEKKEGKQKRLKKKKDIYIFF